MAPRDGGVCFHLLTTCNSLLFMDYTSVHIFRVTEIVDGLEVVRLSPTSAADLTTILQGRDDYRVTMLGTDQVKSVVETDGVHAIDPSNDDNSLPPSFGPFALSAIFKGDSEASDDEVRKTIAEEWDIAPSRLKGTKVSGGYPGQENKPQKMMIVGDHCLTRNVVSGYTTFYTTVDGLEVRASIVDWGNGDQKLAIFDVETDEFLEMRSHTAHNLGVTVQGARYVDMSLDFDIKVSRIPIATGHTFEADDEVAETLGEEGVTQVEMSQICDRLNETSPLIVLGQSDGDLYKKGEVDTFSNDTRLSPSRESLSMREIQALGGASVNGVVRADKTATAPQTTDRVRTVELEPLF